MKPFSFRLDSVRRYRFYLEKRAQRDLSVAKSEVMEQQRAIERLVERRMEIARECTDEGFRGMNVTQYQIYRSFIQRLEHDLESAHISLKEKEGKVKVKEAALKKASIKRKTLDTLKDLQLKQYMTRLEREEQKVMDELVLIGKGGGV